jgi:uncharacterized membrane protein YkoI
VPIKQTITVLIRGIATAGVTVALAACSGGQSPQTGASTPARAEQTDADNQALLRAGKTAQDAVPGSTLASIETERNDTRWEVQLVTADGTEHLVEVSTDGSNVTGGPDAKSETAQDKAKHRNRAQAAKLDYRQAVSAVTQALPGRVTELNLDNHNGTTVWEADVSDSGNTKHEVSIDAASGDIVTKN